MTEPNLSEWLRARGVDSVRVSATCRCVAATAIQAGAYLATAGEGQVKPALSGEECVGRAIQSAEAGQELDVALMVGVVAP
ncbi:MAG TPA: hypothetical protein VH208_04620 [Myxococcaceae bacterium]|nr:hypothetical protein [Myxococcaceae bacterium]